MIAQLTTLCLTFARVELVGCRAVEASTVTVLNFSDAYFKLDCEVARAKISLLSTGSKLHVRGIWMMSPILSIDMQTATGSSHHVETCYTYQCYYINHTSHIR